MFDSTREPPPLSGAEIVDAPDQAAAWLAALLPGGDAAAAIELIDPAILSHAGRVDLLVAIEKQAAWVAATQARVLAAMASDDLPSPAAGDRARQWVREDVACALRLAPVTAQERLDSAVQLARLPGTQRALLDGEIPAMHAAVLTDETIDLDPEQIAAVEERVLSRAGEQTRGNFRRSVRRAVLRTNPELAERRLAEGIAARRACASPDRTAGMSWFSAYLPADGCAALMTALTLMTSRRTDGDERTMDQRRADALVELALRALNDPTLPRQHGARPTIHVTVSVSTLLGIDDEPGELAGYGPIPASLARRIASDESSTWRRLVTDPVTGGLLDYGSTTYRPPKDLAEFVIVRDQQCAFPPCAMPARRCDLDHRVPWTEGGPTNGDNLGPLCRRHHVAKHEAGWHVQRDGVTGGYVWTAPTGHVYRTRPPDLPEDFG